MGVGGAGGRLIEFGQRQRRAQFEAARGLLLRDGDGVWKASSAGAGLRRLRLSSISPRARCSSASNARCPVRSHVASASSRIARARSTSPDRASASASAIFTSPSKVRSYGRAEVRRLDAGPQARRWPCRFRAVAKPSRKTPTLPTMVNHARARVGRVCGRTAIRERSPRISPNRAACKLPFARVPICAKLADLASASPMREAARPMSPNGHRVRAR